MNEYKSSAIKEIRKLAQCQLEKFGQISDDVRIKWRLKLKEQNKQYPKEKFEQKLRRIIDLIEANNNLPLKINEIYTFGSFNKKDKIRDLDLILIYDEEDKEKKYDFYEYAVGYTTTPYQKMNHRLKANNERIDIGYFVSLTDALKHLSIQRDEYNLVWKR